MPKIKYRKGDSSAEGALTFTLIEAARLLGVSPSNMRVMALRGDIPYIRVGRLYRVPRSRLMAMINGEKA